MTPRFLVSCLLLVAPALVPPAAHAENVPVPALTAWAQDMLCAPHVHASPGSADLFVDSALDGTPQWMFGPGDWLVIRGGAAGSLSAGQMYVVQRRPRSHLREYTASWEGAVQRAAVVRVDRVNGEYGAARVLWACDGVERGDEVHPFSAPVGPPAVAAAGTPEFDPAGTVLSGSQSRRMGSAPDLLLVAGADGQSPAGGRRVTFFRRPHGVEGPVAVIGEGVVEATHGPAYVVRVTASTTAVEAGDRVALQR